MTLDPRLLRDAFGCFMTGVTVVTTIGPDGAPLGFTANSFASVSLDPPLLLVSISNRSSNLDAFAKGTGFAINILSEGQMAVSNTFARPNTDRFDGLDWHTGPQGSPVIAGVSAWFDCSLDRAIDAGDHTILIGRVEAFDATTAPGLGYYRGAYVTPASTALSTETGPHVVLGAIIEHEGKVLLVDDGTGGVKLPDVTVGKDGARAALERLFATYGTTAEPGMVYALYDDANRGMQFIVHLCPAADAAHSAGAFVTLSGVNFDDITDPAQRSMLKRFVSEYPLGNYGQYTGSHAAGQVRPFPKG